MKTIKSRVAPILAVLVVSLAAASSATGTASASTGPCGTLPLSSANYTHVVWIWMENHSYGEIIGSPEAPYINSIAGECGLATNYHNISHPSLPNYIAGTSGLPLAELSRFTPDCSPSHKCSTAAQSIFAQVPSWKAYEESMPKNCDRKNSGEYAVRHNPPPYYTRLSECEKKDVPYTQLSADLASGTLPSFSFITPNLIDDMHDGTIAQGDAWLRSNLPAILGSSEYQSGTVAVFVTWDEGEGGTSNECATNTTDVGCHVVTIVLSPSRPWARNPRRCSTTIRCWAAPSSCLACHRSRKRPGRTACSPRSISERATTGEVRRPRGGASPAWAGSRLSEQAFCPARR